METNIANCEWDCCILAFWWEEEKEKIPLKAEVFVCVRDMDMLHPARSAFQHKHGVSCKPSLRKCASI